MKTLDTCFEGTNFKCLAGQYSTGNLFLLDSTNLLTNFLVDDTLPPSSNDIKLLTLIDKHYEYG